MNTIHKWEVERIDTRIIKQHTRDTQHCNKQNEKLWDFDSARIGNSFNCVQCTHRKKSILDLTQNLFRFFFIFCFCDSVRISYIRLLFCSCLLCSESLFGWACTWTLYWFHFFSFFCCCLQFRLSLYISGFELRERTHEICWTFKMT